MKDQGVYPSLRVLLDGRLFGTAAEARPATVIRRYPFPDDHIWLLQHDGQTLAEAEALCEGAAASLLTPVEGKTRASQRQGGGEDENDAHSTTHSLAKRRLHCRPARIDF